MSLAKGTKPDEYYTDGAGAHPIFNDPSGNIATNVTDIATNVTDIATNETDIATNETDIANNSPAGIILPYGGTSAPSGYFLCDGSSLHRVSYAALFTAIGTAFGTYGVTHFNIPDLRGFFLRGRANGLTSDPDRATRTVLHTGGNTGDNVGSKQTSAMWGHFHRFYAKFASYGDRSAVGEYPDRTNYGAFSWVNTWIKSAISDGVHGIPILTSESRPINVYVNYIIKY